MSADNGIYILVTKDTHQKVGAGWVNKNSEGGITAYRIAHAQAIDNLEWYENFQPYNIGYYLSLIWGNAPVVYDLSEAQKYAANIALNYSILEYGVGVIERPEYAFPL